MPKKNSGDSAYSTEVVMVDTSAMPIVATEPIATDGLGNFITIYDRDDYGTHQDVDAESTSAAVTVVASGSHGANAREVMGMSGCLGAILIAAFLSMVLMGVPTLVGATALVVTALVLAGCAIVSTVIVPRVSRFFSSDD